MNLPIDFYDINLAKKIVGIDDEEVLDFYIKGIISQIEAMIGYKLVKGQIKEFVEGLDTNVVYLKGRAIERVTNVLWLNKQINYRQEKHRLFLDVPLCGSEFLEVDYIAGYKKLPFNIQMFIFSSIKETKANEAGLKSFALKDVSYSYFDKVQQSDNFRRGIIDIFGVRI